MTVIAQCNLCGLEKELQKSHVIPNFAYKWLKSTGATGFLISSRNPETRVQDGIKDYLYCSDCEKIFEKFEDKFAKNIFYPYVDEELDDNCIAQGKIKEIKYEEWLLKFIISLQYRDVVYHKNDRQKELKNEKFSAKLDEKIEDWKKYLLDIAKVTNDDESHMFFYQNLAAGYGQLPKRMNPRTASYLLRAIDATLVVSKKKLGNYIKMGPISFFTIIIPPKLKNSKDSRIKKHGTIPTAQKFKNLDINEFLFVTRPNEIMDLVTPSEKRQAKITNSLVKNPERLFKSKTFVAKLADEEIKRRLEEE